jgi:hypothetical protein
VPSNLFITHRVEFLDQLAIDFRSQARHSFGFEQVAKT